MLKESLQVNTLNLLKPMNETMCLENNKRHLATAWAGLTHSWKSRNSGTTLAICPQLLNQSEHLHRCNLSSLRLKA